LFVVISGLQELDDFVFFESSAAQIVFNAEEQNANEQCRLTGYRTTQDNVCKQ
jgi:hypothetical protein